LYVRSKIATGPPPEEGADPEVPVPSELPGRLFVPDGAEEALSSCRWCALGV
jgi:hypothetical protein